MLKNNILLTLVILGLTFAFIANAFSKERLTADDKLILKEYVSEYGLASNDIVIITFTRNDCIACETMKKIHEKIRNKGYRRVRLYTINLDKRDKYDKVFNVPKIPMTLFHIRGMLVAHGYGVLPAPSIEIIIKKLLGKGAAKTKVKERNHKDASNG